MMMVFLSLEHAAGSVQIVSKEPANDWSISTFRVAPNSQTLWVDGQIVGSESYGQGALALIKLVRTFRVKLLKS